MTSPFHLACDRTMVPLAMRKLFEDGAQFPSLCFTLSNVAEHIVLIIAPSSNRALTRMISPCGPAKDVFCKKGRHVR